MQALTALEKSKDFAQLPALFTTKPGDAKELEYLKDALATSLDQIIHDASPDARRLLWMIAVANHPVALTLLQGVWGGETHDLAQLRKLKQLLDRLPVPELQEKLKVLPPEVRARLDALPPAAPARPDPVPLLRYLVAVGPVTEGRTGPDDPNPELACHELVRERIRAWMLDHPRDRDDLTENTICLAYAKRLEAVFNELQHQNMTAAIEAGSRAVVYCVQAAAWSGSVTSPALSSLPAIPAYWRMTLFPIGNLLLFSLEQRFPAPASLPEKVDGIIVLGGAQQPRVTAAYGQRALNGAAERMTTFLALARRYPQARLVFAGGSGDALHPETHEEPTVRMFLEQQSFDANRVQYESGSRTTYENVVNAKALIRPGPEETWLLVQTAAVIPRSIGVFNKQGWTVTPVPCDYNAVPPEWLPGLSATVAFEELDRALHELIGLVVYYITGKTNRLFLGPAAMDIKEIDVARGSTDRAIDTTYRSINTVPVADILIRTSVIVLIMGVG